MGIAHENGKHTYCFYEDGLPDWNMPSITIAEDENGEVWYPVRPMCKGLAVDSPTQAGIIRQDSRLSQHARDIRVPTPGGRQEQLCLTHKGVAIWLAGIDPHRVGKYARGRMEEYQDALWSLADKLVFSRRRTAEASAQGATVTTKLIGTQKGEALCPHCHQPVGIEVEHGDARLIKR